MKLEKQVVSLELAKKLKELGVKQESLFVWVELYHGPETKFRPFYRLAMSGENLDIEKRWSAFTVAELLDLCPASTSMLKRTDLPTKSIPRYYVETFEHYRDSDYDGNPANALAKMLIYLLENDLLNK